MRINILRKMTTPAVAITAFIFLVLVVSTPAILPTLAGNSSTFNVSLTINNAAPTIDAVASISTSPAEGTTKIVSLYFNASDTNGVGDIPQANAQITINRSSESYSSSSCVATAISSTQNEYECNITIDYFASPGIWDINASVYDGASAQAEDTTSADLTMGTTYGMALLKNSLTFSGDPGDTDVNASNAPQIVNNTGNAAFSQLDLKAYALVSGSNTIDAGNFTGGTSDNPASGQTLINNTDVTLSSSTVSVQGTTDVWIYLDIPAGTPDGDYAASDLWVITAS